MPSPFHTLHHVCIVVPDLDEAVRYFESVGVTGWEDYPPLDDYTDISLARDDFDTLTYRFVDLGNVQLQLCHPGPGRTPQRRFLESRGAGVYHLGFGTDDVDAAQLDATMSGLDIRGSGRRADGTGFTYFETERELGVTLEVRSTNR